MVKMYLKDKKEYVDIEFSSIMKAFGLAWISWGVTLLMILIIYTFILGFFGLI